MLNNNSKIDNFYIIFKFKNLGISVIKFAYFPLQLYVLIISQLLNIYA